MCGARAACFVWMLLVMGVSQSSLVMAPVWMASPRGAVKYAARISEAHNPWGTPVFMYDRGSCFLSILTMAFLFWRNE